MFISVNLFIFLLLFTNGEAVDMKTHWTDIVPRTYIRIYGSNAATKQEDSDTFLNEQSRRRTFVQKGKKINAGAPYGHTKRKELKVLSKKRNEYEDRVNGGLISGILLKKVNSKLSHPLLNYAFEQRQKSKEVQRSYIQKDSEGHIDPNAAQFQQKRHQQKYQEKRMKQERKYLKRKRSKVMNSPPNKD